MLVSAECNMHLEFGVYAFRVWSLCINVAASSCLYCWTSHSILECGLPRRQLVKSQGQCIRSNMGACNTCECQLGVCDVHKASTGT